MAREVFDGVLSVIGHGSDGDSRRFRLQQLGMNSEAGIRFGCLAPCFHLTCMQVSGGYRHLHSQDPLHNAKKLQSPADVTSRNLYVGNELATWAMLDQVWRCHNPQDHGLRREDVTRSDRQSVRTVTVTTAKKARECLRKMREEPKDGQSPKDTLGLEIWFYGFSTGKRHLGAPRGRKKLLRTRLGGASAGVVAPPGLRKQTLHRRTWYGRYAAVLPLCSSTGFASGGRFRLPELFGSRLRDPHDLRPDPRAPTAASAESRSQGMLVEKRARVPGAQKLKW